MTNIDGSSLHSVVWLLSRWVRVDHENNEELVGLDEIRHDSVRDTYLVRSIYIYVAILICVLSSNVKAPADM